MKQKQWKRNASTLHIYDWPIILKPLVRPSIFRSVTIGKEISQNFYNWPIPLIKDQLSTLEWALGDQFYYAQSPTHLHHGPLFSMLQIFDECFILLIHKSHTRRFSFLFTSHNMFNYVLYFLLILLSFYRITKGKKTQGIQWNSWMNI